MSVETPVFLYDPVCPRCTGFARFLVRWTQGRVAIKPLDSEGAADLHPDLSFSKMLESAHLVLPNGYLAAGAEAGALALGQRRGWGWLFQFYYFPVIKQLAQGLYWLIRATRRTCSTCS
jgi:predicted DCC family thiol-disulfide oxidoreductase YuxK